MFQHGQTFSLFWILRPVMPINTQRLRIVLLEALILLAASGKFRHVRFPNTSFQNDSDSEIAA